MDTATTATRPGPATATRPGPGPGLAEDYAEIVDEEGDYSSPARVTTISTDINNIY